MRSHLTTWMASGLLVLALCLSAAALVLCGVNGQLATARPWTVLAFFLFSPVGMIIVMLRPRQLIGWLFCGVGVFYTLWAALEGYGRFALLGKGGELPGGNWAAVAQLPAGPISWMLLYYSLTVFPTGRHLSPRWRVFARTVMLLYILDILLDSVIEPSLGTLPVANPLRLRGTEGFSDLYVVARSYLFITFVITLAVCLTVRFRRAKGDERQQLKWLTFVAALWVSVSVTAGLSNLLFPPEIRDAIAGVPIALAITAVPIAVALAILRYRLYDIDLLIRRTLVYSVLTAMLASIYWGGVVGLQALLRPITGEGNDLAIVATTLLVAAIFLPLRRRIQGFIDRRFYRRKYDAAHTLMQFGQVARNEMNLEALAGKLTGVVEETMQPEHVSLWLRR